MPGEMKWHRHKIKYLDTTMPVFPLGNVGVAGRYDYPSKVFPSGNIGVVGRKSLLFRKFVQCYVLN